MSWLESTDAKCALTATCAQLARIRMHAGFFAKLAVIKRSPTWSDRAHPLRPSPPASEPSHSLLLPSPLVRRRCRGATSSSPAWPTVATTAMSSSSATEPLPSAPFGRGLRDVPLAPSCREDHAEPPLYGTSPSSTPSLSDLSILAPGKSVHPTQLRIRGRV